MANAIEDALNRASDEQRERAMQTIDEARRNIQSANMQMGNFPSSDASTTIARNEQIIEEAKRSIPVETMKSVDSVSPPLNTPPMHGQVNSNVIDLNPNFKSDIESIERNGGNNYLNENAVDRAIARQGQETQNYDQPQRAMGR